MIVALTEGFDYEKYCRKQFDSLYKHHEKERRHVCQFQSQRDQRGTSFNASISVDLSAAEVDPADSLEKIIEHCARMAVREFKKSELQFEGLAAV